MRQATVGLGLVAILSSLGSACEKPPPPSLLQEVAEAKEALGKAQIAATRSAEASLSASKAAATAAVSAANAAKSSDKAAKEAAVAKAVTAPAAKPGEGPTKARLSSVAGGDGGSGFELRCPPGFVSTGIRGGAGLYVDSVQVICEPAAAVLAGKSSPLPDRPPAEELVEEPPEPEESATTPPVPYAQWIAKTGLNAWSIDVGKAKGSLPHDDVALLGRQARLVPNYVGGSIKGFRMVAPRPKGLYAAMGLQADDIIMATDKGPIDSPSKAMSMIDGFAGAAGSFTVTIQRAGAEQTFTYTLVNRPQETP